MNLQSRLPLMLGYIMVALDSKPWGNVEQWTPLDHGSYPTVYCVCRVHAWVTAKTRQLHNSLY